MNNELKLADWLIDERTGYLRHKHKTNAITPEQKEAFLEALLKLGTASGAAKLAGFSPSMIAIHKRGDIKFNQDYNATLQAMADTLEGVMYLNAQQPKGTLDRFGWLRAHFPKKWNPKFLADDKETKKIVDDLWNSLETKDKPI